MITNRTVLKYHWLSIECGERLFSYLAQNKTTTKHNIWEDYYHIGTVGNCSLTKVDHFKMLPD